MTKCQSSMWSEDGKPLIKYKGIHEPRGRVKGYRVEIRPSNSPKIWVGTFDTRQKAMRAFDAAVYLTGKEPYYFIYPGNYFPARPATKPRREDVQTQARRFSERTDALQVNPSSFLVHTSSKPGPPEEAPEVKPSDPRFGSLDESLKKAKYLPVSAEQIPVIEEASSCWDLPFGDAVKFGDKMKVDELELKAFDKGYRNLNIPAITVLLDQDLPVEFFARIDGESFLPFPDFAEDSSYSSQPCSKRKREEDSIALPTVEVCDTDVSELQYSEYWFGSPEYWFESSEYWFESSSDPLTQAPTNIDCFKIDSPSSSAAADWSDLISCNWGD